MSSEKKTSVVFGTLITIIVGFLLTISLFIFSTINSVLNVNYYMEMLTSDEVVDLLYEPFCDELERILGVEDVSDYDIDDDLTEEIVQTLASDYIDVAVFEKDPEKVFDEDDYEDFIEDIADSLDLPDDSLDATTESLMSFFKTSSASIQHVNLLGYYSKAKITMNIVAWILIGISLVLTIYSIKIYKNRYRPFKKSSIALLVAGLVNLVTWIILKSVGSAGIISLFSEYKTYVKKLVPVLLDGAFKKPIITSIIVSVVALVAIFIFSFLTTDYDHSKAVMGMHMEGQKRRQVDARDEFTGSK